MKINALLTVLNGVNGQRVAVAGKVDGVNASVTSTTIRLTVITRRGTQVIRVFT